MKYQEPGTKNQVSGFLLFINFHQNFIYASRSFPRRHLVS